MAHCQPNSPFDSGLFWRRVLGTIVVWGPAPWILSLGVCLVVAAFWVATLRAETSAACRAWAQVMVAEAVADRPKPGAYREELPAFDPWKRALVLDLWVGQSSVHARVTSAGHNGKAGDWDDVGASYVFADTAKEGE